MLDTHDDTTQRFFSKRFDLGKRNPDWPHRHSRMRRRRNERYFLFDLIDGRIMGPPAVQKSPRSDRRGPRKMCAVLEDMVLPDRRRVRSAHGKGKLRR